MDVLVTPDVLSRLAITGCSIMNKGVAFPAVLFAFSEKRICFMSSQGDNDFIDVTISVLRTNTNVFEIPMTFESSAMTSSKHFLFSFSYAIDSIDPALSNKFSSLLRINHIQKLRRDERVTINKATIDALKIDNSKNELWIHGSGRMSILHNISYSGASLVSTDDFELEGDDKIILKITFINPMELATLRAVVLRKTFINMEDIPCQIIAVKFFDPVDLVYLTRLTSFFEKRKIN